MKNVILFLIIQNTLAYCQNITSCEPDYLCKNFIAGKYDKNALELINKNYTEYFGCDLKSLKNQDYPSNVSNIELKFDAIGCIYPEFSQMSYENNLLKSHFLDSNLACQNFYKNTFYHLFDRKYFNKKSTLHESLLKNIKYQCESLSNQEFIEPKFEKSSDCFEFIEQWNKVFFEDKIKEIQESIKDKKVFIFIHGYNVPYSLAKIQAIETAKLISSLNMKENYLLIEVYWPSGSFKHSSFTNDSCCTYLNIENINTVRLYQYISNRSYMVGISLRKILNQINKKDLELNVITHSHGASVITTTLINCVNRMGFCKFPKIYDDNNINHQILKRMQSANFPANLKFKIFMNAPAIPGKNTFVDLDFTKPYTFFCGYNIKDRTLLKKKLSYKKLRKNCESYYEYKYFDWAPVLAKWLGSTTLGCNYKNEVSKTEKLFKPVKTAIFNSGIISNLGEHDFFCYILQDNFIKNFNSFFNKKIFTPK